jgi:signal transduction histidine kinase
MHNAAETGLPWDIYLTPAGPGGGVQPYPWEVQRRNLLWVGLVLLVAVVVGGGYFMLRVVARELAVARQQNEFVAAVSHEFRTPLTSLRQFTDLLQDDDALPVAKRRRFYQAQARATARLQGLVESLLDFGRMEAGAHPYLRRPLDVAALVRGVTEDFGREVEAQGFTVQAVTEECGEVEADADALTRALWNLLENAVKYSGDSRTVWVRVERNGGEVAIRVEDRGMGIPRSEQRSVFRRFVRWAEALRNGIKGTGIGLAMVEHTMRAHDGRVELESAPGQGSVFTIRLPQAGEAR